MLQIMNNVYVFALFALRSNVIIIVKQEFTVIFGTFYHVIIYNFALVWAEFI